MPLDIILIPILPLAAFVVQAFFGRRLPRGGDWVPLAAIGLALILSLRLFAQSISAYDPHWQLPLDPWVWLDLNVTRISVGLLVDNITVIMLVVVTLVSGLVHLYSVGYMHGDPRYSRFFGFLAIFSFSMLGLVLVDNFLLLYVFWELVGLSSYLLIGFWYLKSSGFPDSWMRNISISCYFVGSVNYYNSPVCFAGEYSCHFAKHGSFTDPWFTNEQ